MSIYFLLFEKSFGRIGSFSSAVIQLGIGGTASAHHAKPSLWKRRGDFLEKKQAVHHLGDMIRPHQ